MRGGELTKFAIVSDTHVNWANFKKAIDWLNENTNENF